MRHCDILIHGKYIVTQDAQRSILTNASLAIAQGCILALGPTKELCKEYQAKQTLDYHQDLILPGLINAHTHVAMTFLRGFADDLPLMTWLEQKVFPLEAQISPEIVQVSALLGFAEMLATGTTAALDMYLFEEEVLKAAECAGIRLACGEGLFQFPSCSSPSWQSAIETNLCLAERCKKSTRLYCMLSPHSIYTTTKEILQTSLNIAAEYHLPIHIHLAESSTEVQKSLELYNLRPIEYCQSVGLFEHPTTLAHMVEVSEDEYQILKNAHDTVIVHNPTSNLKLASGIAPVSAFLAKNLPVALGTDGAASNNQLNMFAEMKLATLLQKISQKNTQSLSAQSVLDLATINGARAFHQPDLGSLACGKRADLTVLSLNSPNLQPLYVPTSHLVYAATGHEVILTMVEGEILYDHGRFLRFNYMDLLRQMEEIKTFVLKKAKK
ncbi:MAG: amidohydrolase [Desulfovibrio sp.]|nr:amidohydrolase [Desulfovibrio sp.]